MNHSNCMSRCRQGAISQTKSERMLYEEKQVNKSFEVPEKSKPQSQKDLHDLHSVTCARSQGSRAAKVISVHSQTGGEHRDTT